jgi:hypothetical protein
MIGSLLFVAKNCSVASVHIMSCRAFLFRRPIAIGKDRASPQHFMSELHLRRGNGIASSKIRARQDSLDNLLESALELDIQQRIDTVTTYDT